MLAGVAFFLVRLSFRMGTLAMKNIAEVRMKRLWKVRRQFQPTTNAERRWDQAYQHLLEWTLPIEPGSDPLASFCPPAELEVRGEDCDLSTSVDKPSDPSSDH